MKRLGIAVRLFALLAVAAAAIAPAVAHDETEGGVVVGKVEFANSCSPDVQPDLQRAIAMLHSFWYGAGEQAFRAVLAKDPGCVIADWGIASLLMQNPLAGVGSPPQWAARAQAALDEADRVGARTQRENDYIEAVGAYYKDFDQHTERERQAARAKAYEALAARYPDDDEAQIFSALYIAGTQSQADQNYTAYRRAQAILNEQFARHPDHPGVAHYLIHVYDAPPLARDGLPAAMCYADIAPAAAHALHMPSHIFTRVGAWEQSAATNTRSFEAALRNGEKSEAYHASDYLVYADLQLGRDAAAQAALQAVMQVTVSPPVPAATPYAKAAMPARIALERNDWRAAAALTPQPDGLPYTEALTYFARAIGAARSDDPAAAEQAAAELAARQKALAAANNTYWAGEVENQARIANAWAAFARHDTDRALALMRQAADQEDKIEKHIVSPGRLLPARELLADMLLEAGQPAAALAEYEASRTRDPNRFRGYDGAARAAEAAGDQAAAKANYDKLLLLAATADTPRQEIAAAKAAAGQ
jgi:predicted Zn-dependent protease